MPPLLAWVPAGLLVVCLHRTLRRLLDCPQSSEGWSDRADLRVRHCWPTSATILLTLSCCSSLRPCTTTSWVWICRRNDGKLTVSVPSVSGGPPPTPNGKKFKRVMTEDPKAPPRQGGSSPPPRGRSVSSRHEASLSSSPLVGRRAVQASPS